MGKKTDHQPSYLFFLQHLWLGAQRNLFWRWGAVQLTRLGTNDDDDDGGDDDHVWHNNRMSLIDDVVWYMIILYLFVIIHDDIWRDIVMIKDAWSNDEYDMIVFEICHGTCWWWWWWWWPWYSIRYLWKLALARISWPHCTEVFVVCTGQFDTKAHMTYPFEDEQLDLYDLSNLICFHMIGLRGVRPVVWCCR